MLLLARHLGAPLWGGLVVTLGYLFNGFFIEHAQYTSWIYSFAALPWIVWRLDVAILQRRTLPALESGALWGLSAMAGYPGVVVATGMTAGLWGLGRILCWPPGRGAETGDRAPASDDRREDLPVPATRPGWLARFVRVAWLLFLWSAAGMVVMSPTMVTILRETRGYSDRNRPLPREVAVGSNALPGYGLLSLATPYVATCILLRSPPSVDCSASCLYLGCCATWLALGALLMRPGQAWRWWLVVMAAIGIGLALGPVLPLRGWLYDYFPPSRYFRHTSIFQAIPIFVAFVLAALATADLAEPSRPEARPRQLRLLAAAVLVVLAGIIAYRMAWARWGMIDMAPAVQVMKGYLGFVGVVTIAVLGLLAAGRWRTRTWPLFVAVLCLLAAVDAYKTACLVRFVTSSTHPDITADWNRLVRGHPTSLDVSALTGWDRALSAEATPVTGARGHKHLLSKTPVLQAATPMTLAFQSAWLAEPVLRNAALGARRVWFSPQHVEAPWQEGALLAFQTRSVELGTPPMVIHRPEALGQPDPGSAGEAAIPRDAILRLPAATPIDVTLLDYHPNTLAFRAVCPADGWLVVTDRWAPGWTATVNGRPAVVYGGMFLFRAVQVQAGNNDIFLRYCPGGYPWLLLLSYATLGTVLAGSCWTQRRSHRQSRSGKPAIAGRDIQGGGGALGG